MILSPVKTTLLLPTAFTQTPALALLACEETKFIAEAIMAAQNRTKKLLHIPLQAYVRVYVKVISSELQKNEKGKLKRTE
jgi:hypothetical protein